MTLEERIKKYMDEEGMSEKDARKKAEKEDKSEGFKISDLWSDEPLGKTASNIKKSVSETADEVVAGTKKAAEKVSEATEKGREDKKSRYKNLQETLKAERSIPKKEEEAPKSEVAQPTEDVPETATLAENIKRAENPETAAEVRTTWDSLKKKLVNDEKAVEDLKTKEAGKLQTEEQRRKQSSKLGVLLKSLLNSAALLYAAKKGVVSDIKLETPDDAKQIRDIERDMDYERTLLRDRISETRRTNSEVSRIEEGGLRRKEAQDDRTDARNKSIKLAEAKANARDAKDIKKAAADEDKILDKIIDKFEGDDEAMRAALEAHGMDTEIAKDISGDTRSYFWDTPAGGQKLYELKQKHIRNILGGTNAKKSTDNTVTGNDASKGPRKQISNKGNTQYKLGEKIISEEEYLRLKGKIRNVK